MAGKTTRLTSPTGAPVSVAAEKVDGLLARGFKRDEVVKPAATVKKAAAKRAPAKKAAAKKSTRKSK